MGFRGLSCGCLLRNTTDGQGVRRKGKPKYSPEVSRCSPHAAALAVLENTLSFKKNVQPDISNYLPGLGGERTEIPQGWGASSWMSSGQSRKALASKHQESPGVGTDLGTVGGGKQGWR